MTPCPLPPHVDASRPQSIYKPPRTSFGGTLSTAWELPAHGITEATYEMDNFVSTTIDEEGSQISPDNTHADNGLIKGSLASGPTDYEVPSRNNTEIEEPDNEVAINHLMKSSYLTTMHMHLTCIEI